ncbi:hypothetical protein MKX01_024769 [Papaver californicum]|nr:hypothetical protein MKX01_024769 [Papaver californicum]
MIQELLKSAGLLSDGGGERKYPYFHCGIEAGSPNSTSSYATPTSSIPSTPTTTAATTMTTTTITAISVAADTPTPTSNTNTTNTSSSDQPSLRCPRCDSPNTKFCYYNNYNLTQPRHFCKTCRRYWTKGGALRNVPIGGGCRKNKNSTASTTTTSSGIPSISTAGKTSAASGYVVGANIIKTSSDNNRNGFDFDHLSQTNPILWSSSAAPQNSSQQLLALLRSASSYSQNTNPNPNNNCHVSSAVKDEAGFMMGSFMGCTSESALNTTTSSLNTKNLNLDPLLGHQVNPIGLCGNSSYWRNNQQQNSYLLQQDNNNNNNNEVRNDNTSGIQELYQRLRSSTNYYSSNTTDHTSGLFMNINIGSSTPSSYSSSILESSPVASVSGVGDMGYSWMNPQFSWSDLSTATNGSFP